MNKSGIINSFKEGKGHHLSESLLCLDYRLISERVRKSTAIFIMSLVDICYKSHSGEGGKAVYYVSGIPALQGSVIRVILSSKYNSSHIGTLLYYADTGEGESGE